MFTEIKFYRSGEWTGVYVDGRLVRHGDHYLADEWLQDHVGVEVIDSDDWLPDGCHPLPTLNDVREEAQRREGLRASAARKRAEAAELQREADELDKQIRPLGRL